LQALPGGTSPQGVKQDEQVELPHRGVKNFKEGENLIHGWYARKKDRQAVEAVLAERISGMEQETSNLRRLMRGLLERESDDALLVDVYSQAARQLGVLLSTGEIRQPEKKDPWVEDFLHRLDEFQASKGLPPVSDLARAEALGISSDSSLADGMVSEEIATIRMLLRNVYRRALECDDPREYLHLVDLYGMGCMRMSKLIKIEGSTDDARLVKYLQDGFDEAIRQLRQEWGLD
jgi:hypothetical protein